MRRVLKGRPASVQWCKSRDRRVGATHRLPAALAFLPAWVRSGEDVQPTTLHRRRHSSCADRRPDTESPAAASRVHDDAHPTANVAIDNAQGDPAPFAKKMTESSASTLNDLQTPRFFCAIRRGIRPFRGKFLRPDSRPPPGSLSAPARLNATRPPARPLDWRPDPMENTEHARGWTPAPDLRRALRCGGRTMSPASLLRSAFQDLHDERRPATGSALDAAPYAVFSKEWREYRRNGSGDGSRQEDDSSRS